MPKPTELVYRLKNLGHGRLPCHAAPGQVGFLLQETSPGVHLLDVELLSHARAGPAFESSSADPRPSTGPRPSQRGTSSPPRTAKRFHPRLQRNGSGAGRHAIAPA